MANKAIPGRSYEVIYKDANTMSVNYNYVCPHCGEDVVVAKEYAAESLSDLVRGNFFEELTCEHCKEAADVRYLAISRI